MEMLEQLMIFLLNKKDVIKALFFASSIFCLRQSVLSLLVLHRTAAPIFRNTKKLNIFLRQKLFGSTIYVTFKRGKESTHKDREPTYENETMYVQAWRGMESGNGNFHHEELLNSNKAAVWISLCMTFASYTFLATVIGLVNSSPWDGYLILLICTIALIQALSLMTGFLCYKIKLCGWKK